MKDQDRGGGVLYPTERLGGEAPEEQGVEGEAQEDGHEDERHVRAPLISVAPSREEVLQHRLKHHPYRLWCPHCVRGKGREDQHRRSSQKDLATGIPRLSSDYF